MPAAFPRCQITPLPDQRVAFSIDGREVTRWNFSESHPRPFFFPVTGPSGESVTRMGHPGAPNHDHHQSVWFAHNKVLGIDFWGNVGEARIRQVEWLAYVDSDARAVMAAKLAWLDGHDPQPLLHQELVACVEPLGDAQSGEWTLELQSRFTPTAESLEFQKTNFGFLAVRVAKRIAAYFGEGKLTNSEGAEDERNIFGKPAKWMDYSGPTRDGGQEGIAYLDHPSNLGQPMRWHVREDGWMGSSPCMTGPLVAKRSEPLVMRQKLVIHQDGVDAARLNQLHQQFSATAPWTVHRSKQKHTHAEVHRVDEA